MKELSDRAKLALTAALVGGTAVLLYWPTLRLPLIYDTLLHIRITKSLDFANVWLPTEAFGFYRPLTFLPLLIIKSLWGYYPNWLLHGLNVFQHGLNAALLSALVWRLWRSWPQAIVTGLLFALFPFSYQAVAVYGHNVHPAIAGLILLGLHAYLTAKQKAVVRIHNSQATWGRPQSHNSQFFWWSLTAVFFLLSLLSHESAVLFGAFAALVQFANPKSKIQNPKSHPWLIFLALGALYAISYQFLPISRAPQAGVDEMGGLWLRLLYLLQSGAYPFAWFAHLFPKLRADGVALIGVALTLALVIWRIRQTDGWRPLLLGWGWWALAAGVIVIPLPTGYLLHGPRLLYLGSIGVAVGWGALLTVNSQQLTVNGQHIVARGGRLLLLVFILGTSGLFVRGRLADYERLTAPVMVMREVMAARPSAGGALFVNLPQWIAPPRNTYAVGVEFVAMLGDYLFVEELGWENGAPGQMVQAVVVPDLLRETSYGYALHDQTPLSELKAGKTETAVILTRYLDAGVTGEFVGTWQLLPPDGRPPLWQLGPYRLEAGNAVLCDGQTAVTLAWQLEKPAAIPPTTSLFVQLFDDAGQLIAQADGPPLGLRADLLPAGPLQLTDVRQLPTGRSQPVSLWVGAYDFVSGERLPGVDGGGRSLPDNAALLEINQCQP